MNTRTCTHCQAEIDWRARADARYCSGACRVAAHRARRDPVPAELRERDRWVRHQDKRPITTEGRAASSTDPSSWDDYESAVSSEEGDGAGFVLDGDGIVCIDLDKCVHRGRIAPWARDIISAAGDTYVEYSPSGTGLHVWGWAPEFSGGRVVDGVEVYAEGRYLTVTGDRMRGKPSRLGRIDAVVSHLAD